MRARAAAEIWKRAFLRAVCPGSIRAGEYFYNIAIEAGELDFTFSSDEIGAAPKFSDAGFPALDATYPHGPSEARAISTAEPRV